MKCLRLQLPNITLFTSGDETRRICNMCEDRAIATVLITCVVCESLVAYINDVITNVSVSL